MKKHKGEKVTLDLSKLNMNTNIPTFQIPKNYLSAAEEILSTMDALGFTTEIPVNYNELVNMITDIIRIKVEYPKLPEWNDPPEWSNGVLFNK